MEKKTPAVKMRNISKRFGTIQANDKCWLDIYRGEILARGKTAAAKPRS